MTPSPEGTPLSRLVLFMVCLSIAGSFLAGLHWFIIDQPAQLSLQAPENQAVNQTGICRQCIAECRGKITENYLCRGICYKKGACPRS